MWNYRVVRRKHRWWNPQTNEEEVTYSYGIYEAYYDHQGYVGSITQEAIAPYGESIEELRHTWVMMVEAFGQPILDYDTIPEPGYDREHDPLGAYGEPTTEEEESYEKSLISDVEQKIWETCDEEDMHAYKAQQEEQRQAQEIHHQATFIGTPTLKQLIDKVYADYTIGRER